jgi:hypothetical protein
MAKSASTARRSRVSITAHGLRLSLRLIAQKSCPSGAPTRAAAASIAVMPGSTRMSRSRHWLGPDSTASNTAEAMAKTPGSPELTTTTRRPSAASDSASCARSISTRLSLAFFTNPGRSATRAT